MLEQELNANVWVNVSELLVSCWLLYTVEVADVSAECKSVSNMMDEKGCVGKCLLDGFKRCI